MSDKIVLKQHLRQVADVAFNANWSDERIWNFLNEITEPLSHALLSVSHITLHNDETYRNICFWSLSHIRYISLDLLSSAKSNIDSLVKELFEPEIVKVIADSTPVSFTVRVDTTSYGDTL